MAYCGISRRGGPGRKRLVRAALALSVWIIPFTAHSWAPKRSSDLAYGTESAIRVVRQDRLVLGPATRICVATTVDPEAKRIVEASGQPLDPDTAKGLTYFTTSRLREEFRNRRWSDSPRDRILAYIEHERDPKGCFDRPDTILVRQRVARGKSRLGYAVTLTATQGRRAYQVAVERPYAVQVSDEIRAVIDYRSNYVPGTQQPYWDPRRDSAKLSDMFILYLLEGSGTGDSRTISDESLAGTALKTSGPAGATLDEARIRRLSTAELEALIPGKRLIHQDPVGRSPGGLMVEEMFYTRPSAYALARGAPYSTLTRAYLVQYPSHRDGGDYFIRDNAICIKYTQRKSEKCRSIYKDEANYYISRDGNMSISLLIVVPIN